MTRRELTTSDMYPGIASLQPILIDRQEDFMEEARQVRLRDLARAGRPRRSRLTATRQSVGLAMVGLGQRLAGTTVEAVERLPAKPVPHGAR